MIDTWYHFLAPFFVSFLASFLSSSGTSGGGGTVYLNEPISIESFCEKNNLIETECFLAS